MEDKTSVLSVIVFSQGIFVLNSFIQLLQVCKHRHLHLYGLLLYWDPLHGVLGIAQWIIVSQFASQLLAWQITTGYKGIQDALQHVLLC